MIRQQPTTMTLRTCRGIENFCHSYQIYHLWVVYAPRSTAPSPRGRSCARPGQVLIIILSGIVEFPYFCIQTQRGKSFHKCESIHVFFSTTSMLYHLWFVNLKKKKKNYVATKCIQKQGNAASIGYPTDCRVTQYGS